MIAHYQSAILCAVLYSMVHCIALPAQSTTVATDTTTETRVGFTSGVRLALGVETLNEGGLSRMMIPIGLQIASRNKRFEWGFEAYYVHQPYSVSRVQNTARQLRSSRISFYPEAQILDINLGDNPASTTISALVNIKYFSPNISDKLLGYVRGYAGSGYNWIGSSVIVRSILKPGRSAENITLSQGMNSMIPFVGFSPGFEYRFNKEWSIAVESFGFHATASDGWSFNAFNIVVSRFF